MSNNATMVRQTHPFRFSTKAETLENLKLILKTANLLPQLYFTVAQWNADPGEWVRKIQAYFKTDRVVVRSSALNEDTLTTSMAGKYKSVLDVSLHSESEIQTAVREVVESYGMGPQVNPDNQVLVQPYVKNVVMSGVMFTVDLESGSPYLVINYDDTTGKSDTVTSGNRSEALKIFYYFKHQDRLPSNPKLQALIALARDLESLTLNGGLDIEFVFSGDELYLLQVRPITSVREIASEFAHEFKNHLERIQEFLRENNRPQPNLYGYRTVYGVMPDWNPAEIVGVSPKSLAFSLYKELITDKIWPQSRKRLGYMDVGHAPGIHSFVGKPYVDVRMSLNTFLPKGLSDFTAAKLVDFYIYKLINHPELHDKLEFDIAYTCYKPNFRKEEEELRQNNFTTLQIKEIKEALLVLTNSIINEQVTSVAEQLELTRQLDPKRKKIVASDIRTEVKIAQLIEDCKTYGTMPFSILARFAFISNIILKDLVSAGVIGADEYARFFNSIKTVAAEFLEELADLKKHPEKKQAFLEKYGHLRPGTYDLSSKSYSEAFDEYIDLKHFEANPQSFESFEFSEEKKARIAQLFAETGFTFSVDQFLNFAKESIRGREEAKFQFTKNVHQILEYCAQSMAEYGIPREDVAFLTLPDILRHAYESKPPKRAEMLKRIIREHKEYYLFTRAVKLPPIIHDDRNVLYFHMLDNKPNYITNKSITGDVVYVSPENFGKEDLEDKIVLIENADPGYDWIFSHNIKALITKYGGVASHMSIRATEFNLPAIIGAGEAVFLYAKASKKLELNCAAKQIKRIL